MSPNLYGPSTVEETAGTTYESTAHDFLKVYIFICHDLFGTILRRKIQLNHSTKYLLRSENSNKTMSKKDSVSK